MKTGRKCYVAAACGLLATVAITGVTASQDGPLVFVSWGGLTQEHQIEAWAPPFTEETGVAVVSDGPTNYGKFKAMVEAGAVSWDVVDVEGDWAARADQEGLLEKLDFSVISTENVDKKYYTDYGAASFQWSFALGYNTDLVQGQPESWADFFDTQKYPGKRGFIGWMTGGALEMALLADGVAAEDLYPLDVERAFRKLDTIKKDLVFWDSGASMQAQLATGEVAICFCWDGRLGQLVREGAPVGVQWHQQLASVDYLVVPKGSKNKELAMKFINIALTPEGQAKMAANVITGPVNSQAKDLIDPDVYQYLNVAHAETLIDINLDYWRDHGSELSERWAKWKVE